MKLHRLSMCSVFIWAWFILATACSDEDAAANYQDATPIEQISALTTLAKFWGVFKYYHPEVAEGEIDWDQALRDAIPEVQAAPDRGALNNIFDRLIREAGNLSAGQPPVPLSPALQWIKDDGNLVTGVRDRLWTLVSSPAPANNHYVAAVQGAGNTTFDNETPFDSDPYPVDTLRLLALFRYWNIIHYFFPYKSSMDLPWDDALPAFIPRMIAAADETEYHLALKELSTYLNDGHGFTLSPVIDDYFGQYYAPFTVSHIEGQPVVSSVEPGVTQVLPGDIIVKARQMEVFAYWEQIRKYTVGSNDSYLNANLCAYLTRGATDPMPFTISREGELIDVTVPPSVLPSSSIEAEQIPSRDDPSWELLPDNIGYINMGLLQAEQIAPAMAELEHTKAIVFDSRNYPEFLLYEICPYLNDQPREFVTFTEPDLTAPGEMNWTEPYLCSTEANPDYYKGRVVVLVNEKTMSLAEFTVMAFQTAPDATVIGSQTAGADGNVSTVWLPGRFLAYFTGLGVYYPDRSPTQRIGIVPDINVRPTIAGMRAGRDEVLERALQFIETGR